MSYEFRFEPPNPKYDLDIEDYPTSCHNCDEDCPGAYLICRGEVE